MCWCRANQKFVPTHTSCTKLKNKKTCTHFSATMDVSHLKHSELAAHLQKDKGRIVFQGDTVQHGIGCQAAFQMTAAKVVGTIFRVLGKTGEAEGRSPYSMSS